MYYIFNKDNICVTSCDFKPNIEDLESRGEYCKEFESKISIGDILHGEDVITHAGPEQTINYEQKARRLRDSIRDQIDIYVLPTSTINYTLVTEEQKDVLVQESLTLAKWPSLEGWPFIDLPELSSLTKSIIQIPVWEYQVAIETELEVII